MVALVSFKPSVFEIVSAAHESAIADSTHNTDSTGIAEVTHGIDSIKDIHSNADSLHDENTLAPQGEGVTSKEQNLAEKKDTMMARSTPRVAAMTDVDSLQSVNKKKMTQMIELMNPENAVKILNGMSDPEIKSILLNLKRKQASKILSALSPERAVRIMR